MGRPYGLLRAGFPFFKTVGMRRHTNFPVDVALGKENRLYILCRSGDASMVRKYSVDEDNLGEIGGVAMWGVAIIADSEENLYISDEAKHCIASFNADGEALGTWGEHGDGDGQLNAPSGIAFDPEENIYVADGMNHRVQKFTKDGEFISKWGSYGDGEGEFNMPWGITVDELGDVYVVDWRNDRVQKFNSEGEFIFAFGKSGSGNGEFNRPTDVAVDEHGDIYVADCGNNRVQLFNSEPRYVEKFLGDATLSQTAIDYMMTNANPNRLRDMANLEPQKLLRRPTSVTINGDGLLFISDNCSYRVQVYKKHAIPLTELELGPPRRSPTLHQE